MKELIRNMSSQDADICHSGPGGDSNAPLKFEGHCLSLVLTKQGPLELDAGGPTAFLKAFTCRAGISLPWGCP